MASSSSSMSYDDNHIRHCVLYEYRSGLKAKQAFEKFSAVYPGALSLSKCEKWFAKFKSGDYDLGDRPKSGRPSETDIDVLRDHIESDPRLSSRELAIRLGTTHTTVLRHLHDMGKVSKCGIWVPHKLTENQLLQRVTICTSLLARIAVDPFLNRIITGDEKWVLYVNVERKKQWLELGQKPVPTPKPGLHPKKVLLCVWWDMDGVVHFELLDMGQAITAEVYCQQLDRLRTKLATDRPALVNRKGVILHQDNARPHTAKLTRDKLKSFGWEVLPHPSFSPDIAPSDYHLFQSLQHFLSGKDFNTKEEIEIAIAGFFSQKPKKFYRDGIEEWPRRWERVVENDGQYIID